LTISVAAFGAALIVPVVRVTVLIVATLALIAKTLNLKEEREKFIQSNSYEELLSALKSE
jgi:hypothetical protein